MLNRDPMLECWPVIKIVYRVDGSRRQNQVTGGVTWITNPTLHRNNAEIVNETFTDVYEASKFIWNQMQDKTSHLIDQAYLEITFSDGTQLIDFIPISKGVYAANISDPKYLLSLIIKEKMLKQFHDNMKAKLPLASDHFIEDFTYRTAMIVPPEIRAKFDPKRSIIDGTIKMFEEACQKVHGRVVLETEITNNQITFDNGVTIQMGDTIEVHKRHIMGFDLYPRGTVLSIHKDVRAFKVRTQQGITMFKFQDTKFMGEKD